jgi:hypothetical protein
LTSLSRKRSWLLFGATDTALDAELAGRIASGHS